MLFGHAVGYISLITGYLVESNRRGSVPCTAWRIAVRVTLSESWPPQAWWDNGRWSELRTSGTRVVQRLPIVPQDSPVVTIPYHLLDKYWHYAWRASPDSSYLGICAFSQVAYNFSPPIPSRQIKLAMPADITNPHGLFIERRLSRSGHDAYIVP